LYKRVIFVALCRVIKRTEDQGLMKGGQIAKIIEEGMAKKTGNHTVAERADLYMA